MAHYSDLILRDCIDLFFISFLFLSNTHSLSLAALTSYSMLIIQFFCINAIKAFVINI